MKPDLEIACPTCMADVGVECVGLDPEMVHFGRRLERLIRQRESDGTPEGKVIRAQLEQILSSSMETHDPVLMNQIDGLVRRRGN